MLTYFRQSLTDCNSAILLVSKPGPFRTMERSKFLVHACIYCFFMFVFAQHGFRTRTNLCALLKCIHCRNCCFLALLSLFDSLHRVILMIQYITNFKTKCLQFGTASTAINQDELHHLRKHTNLHNAIQYKRENVAFISKFAFIKL